MPVSLRPETPADAVFVRDLLRATVSAELFADTWDENLRGPLLDIQYRGRMVGLSTNYPHAERSIILDDDVAVGWMVVDRSGETIHLADIAILPARRGTGIGTAALRALLSHADQSARAITLEVFRTNPAVRLYARLGFQRTGGTEVQHFLRREPA